MVSIIILVQDRLELLSRCLNSVLASTTTDYELVLVLQAIPEGSPIRELCYSLPCKKVIIENQVNNGVTPGRNQGIAASSGDYLLFFDDDAFVEDNLSVIPDAEIGGDWLSRMTRYYSNPVVGIVSQSGSYINPKTPGTFWECKERGGFCDVGQGYCFMFSRAVVNAIGGLDEFFGKFWHEESEYALRAKASGFKVVNCGYIGVYHLGSGSGDDGTYGKKIKYMFSKWQPRFSEILERKDF